MRKPIQLTLIIFILGINVVCTKPAINEPDNNLTAQSSEKATTSTTITYLIPKGQQYSKPNPLVFTAVSKVSFIAVFDSSCIYKTVDPANQDDINKLYGFSDCNTHHLTNSARIGWRWSKDSLRLFGFVHNDGNMLWQEITSAPIGSKIRCSITCLADTYSFVVNGKTTSLPRHCSGKYTRYKLFPYFGGDEVAPHDIKIRITEL